MNISLVHGLMCVISYGTFIKQMDFIQCYLEMNQSLFRIRAHQVGKQLFPNLIFQ